MSTSNEKLGDRYVIEDTRVGGYSVVVKAVDEKINRTVAIKTPNELVLSSEENLNKFIEEAKKLAKINHPNVIEVLHFYEVGELDDKCHIVMEWVNKTLAERISDDSLDYETKLSIIKQILSGIQHIHEIGVIHSDLKPANIFISDDNSKVKIGDLGIARNIDEEHTSMATFKYGAPEHYRTDVNLDLRADIYSAGLMFYELLAGEKKFKEAFYDIYSDDNNKKQDTRWLNWHLDKDRSFPALSGLGLDVSDKISNIIDKMAAKDVTERYQDVNEVLNDIQGIDKQPSDLEIKPIELEDTKSKVPLWIGLGAALLLVSVAAFLFGPILFGNKNKNVEPAVSVEDVVNMSQEAKNAKEAAISAGADDPAIDEFLKGNNLFEDAKIAYDKGENKQPLELFTQSRDMYLASEGLAFKRTYHSHIDSIQKLEALASDYKLDEKAQPYSNALKLLNSARKHFENDQFKEAVTGLGDIKSSFEKVIKTFPRNINIGSSATQIENALQLCKRFDDACMRDWYESEISKEVTIKPFEIDEHEVTRGLFEIFVDSTQYKTDAEKNGYSYSWDGKQSVKRKGMYWRASSYSTNANHPVTHVSFNDATAYCKWKDARLPTEAEWEYAARGKEGLIFPWGNNWDPSKIYWLKNAGGKAILNNIKSYPASISGSKGYDYSGSVWEWVLLEENSQKGLLKGGSYLEHNPANLRITTQRINDLNVSNNDDGFRCAKSTQEWPESYN